MARCIDSDANQRILTTYQLVSTNNWRDDQSILIMGGYSPVRHHAKLELWTKSCKPLGDSITPQTQTTEPRSTCPNVTHSIWLESTSTNPSSWVIALGWKWGLASTKLWVVIWKKHKLWRQNMCWKKIPREKNTFFVATLWFFTWCQHVFLEKKILMHAGRVIANLNWYVRNHLRCKDPVPIRLPGRTLWWYLECTSQPQVLDGWKTKQLNMCGVFTYIYYPSSPETWLFASNLLQIPCLFSEV